MDSPDLSSMDEASPLCLGNGCCNHAGCICLKARALCRKWYFLRWVPSSFATSWDMLEELRMHLGEQKFRSQPATWRSGVCEALVKFELCGGVHGMTPFLLPQAQSSSFERAGSTVDQLRCCWDCIKEKIPSWLACLPADQEDSAVMGDTHLGGLLLEEIRQVAEGRNWFGTNVTETRSESSETPRRAGLVDVSHQGDTMEGLLN